eukprot:3886069-Prymnesium_polylepis.1
MERQPANGRNHSLPNMEPQPSRYGIAAFQIWDRSLHDLESQPSRSGIAAFLRVLRSTPPSPRVRPLIWQVAFDQPAMLSDQLPERAICKNLVNVAGGAKVRACTPASTNPSPPACGLS